MSSFGTHIGELDRLERLALMDTAVHRLHPLVKMCAALVYIVAVVSLGRYDFVRLAPFFFYPAVVIALAEIPYRALLPKLLVALPFCLFAGLSNVFFERDTAFFMAGIPVSYGLVSMATILLKMILSVLSALLLAATTPMTEISAQLRRLGIPWVFVTVFEMTYRYIGVLLAEAHAMTLAYLLRSGGKKALEMRHMGSFVGQLLLRGFDRAERVYASMALRGYGCPEGTRARRRFGMKDGLALIIVCVFCGILRWMRIG